MADDDCPDTGEHPRSECPRHGCQNLLDELEDLAPCGTSGRGLRGWLD